MQYKIISFYSEPESDSTYYTNHAKRFISECEKYDLDYHVEELKGEGNYFKNCRLKAGFIQSCMDKFKMPLVWLDIDTYIERSPDIDNLSNVDFAGVKRLQTIEKPKPRKFYGDRSGDRNDKSFKSGYPIFAHCLFFNSTPNSLKVLETWKSLCDKEQGANIGDHSLLCKTLTDKKVEYKFIDDFTKYTLAPVSMVKSKER